MAKNSYGSAIASLRAKQGISEKTLADILLIQPEKLLKVEGGEGKLSEMEIRLAAEVFGVDSDELEKGVVSPPKYHRDMDSKIRELQGIILILHDRTKEILNEIKASFPQVRIPRSLENRSLKDMPFDVSGDYLTNSIGVIADSTAKEDEISVMEEIECQNTQMMHI